MDSNSLIIGLLFAVAIGVPFLFLRRSIQKKNKQMLGKLITIAAQSSSEISQFDLKKDMAIGIDEKQLLLFFILDNEHLSYERVIDLKNVKQCKVEKMTRNTGDNEASQSAIEKINLVFSLKGKEKDFVMLELYNTEYGALTLAGELELAQKWELIVNQKIVAGFGKVMA